MRRIIRSTGFTHAAFCSSVNAALGKPFPGIRVARLPDVARPAPSAPSPQIGFRFCVWSLPLEAIPTGTAVGWLSGPDGVAAVIANKATVPVGSQFLKVIARSAVRAPQDEDGIRHGETPPFLPLRAGLYAVGGFIPSRPVVLSKPALGGPSSPSLGDDNAATTEYVIKNCLRDIYDETGMSNRLERALWYLAHTEDS